MQLLPLEAVRKFFDRHERVKWSSQKDILWLRYLERFLNNEILLILSNKLFQKIYTI